MRRDHPEVHSAIYSNQLDNSGRGKIGRPLTILGSSDDPRYSSEAEHRCVADRGGGGGGEEGKDAAGGTGHPSQFTAWDFTVAWNQAWKPGNRLAEADSQSDFSLSQHRGSAFETKRNMRHINCLPVWPG